MTRFCQTRKPNIEGKIKNFNRKRTASGSSNESRKRIATGEIKTGDSPSEASPMSDFNIENLDTNLPNLTTEEVDLLLKDGRNLEGIIPSYEERPKIKNGDIFPKIGNFDWKICAAFALFALPTILFQVFQL